MKILIVDDEQPARERLKRLLNEIGGYEIVAEAANGIETVRQFNDFQPDIVLLDIRMPLMDGIETAQHLTAHEQPPAIIFTTAYEEHAVQAFDAHAVDYLLKPIRVERLKEALQTARRPTRAQRSTSYEALSQTTNPNAPRTHICVRKRDKLELINIDSIYYFFAEHKYVTLRYQDGEALLEDSLIKLEKEFMDRFVRIHRNALVAKSKISALKKQADGSHQIVFSDIDHRMEVSRRHLPFVRRMLTH